jgi:DNA transformation protein
MANKEYLAYLLELLAPLHATSRAMFGGFGIYRNGLMFALVADDQLYAKVDASNKADYEEAGSQPFTPAIYV